MDYFGRIVDDITDLWNEIDRSPYAAEAKPVLKSLEKAMEAAVRLEQQRTRQYQTALKTVAPYPSARNAKPAARP